MNAFIRLTMNYLFAFIVYPLHIIIVSAIHYESSVAHFGVSGSLLGPMSTIV